MALIYCNLAGRPYVTLQGQYHLAHLLDEDSATPRIVRYLLVKIAWYSHSGSMTLLFIIVKVIFFLWIEVQP